MINRIQKLFLLILIAGTMTACQQPLQQQTGAPSWAGNVVWYQIFVERFHNGDTTNDPTPEDIAVATQIFPVPSDWKITSWTSDWWKMDPWAEDLGISFRNALQHRRYGGDFKGVINKLDYLQDLGVTALYLNPVNDAPSLHKYDARSYHHMDVNFGPDPEGDKKIIASEDPNDPTTWKWTSADLLFLELVSEVHRRGMKIILDYSWNHTGVEFWAWKDILAHQEKSKYKDWYEIHSFDNPATPENEFSYTGWANVSSLPELKKTDLPRPRVSGHPYEGNVHPEVKKHIFDATRRWLAPNGDISKGIDGFRLDVAEQVPMGFWKEYRIFVKNINPEAYLTGEIWWEKWPDKLMNPTPYINDSCFDAVMFYQIYRPARNFFVQGSDAMSSANLADSLMLEWNRIPEAFRWKQMNVNCTHDSPRLLTCFANKGKYKYHVNPYENPQCITGRPDEETWKRVRLYLAHQFTLPGSPSIWNGDEMGMWGSDDPDNRKPLWWPGMQFDPETRTNLQPGPKSYDSVGFDSSHFDYIKNLIRLRKENPALVNGDIRFIPSPPQILVYARTLDQTTLTVILNASSLEQEYTPDMDFSGTDINDQTVYSSGKMILPPLSFKILKTTN